MTAGDVQRRLLRGDWLLVHPTVAIVAGAPVTHLARCWAAVLAVGEPCTLRGRSAAVLLGLDRAPEVDGLPPDVAVPRPRRAPALGDGVVVRRVVRRAHRVVHVDGLPVTPPALTLRELARQLPHPWVRDMTQHALRRRRVTLTGLAAELGRGLPGAARLREVITEVAPGYDVIFEGLLHDALRDAGVELEPQLEVTLLDGSRAFLDLGSSRLRLAVEVDGLAAHLDRFALDRRRDRLLTAAGWLVVRVAAEEVQAHLPRVVAELAAIARRRTTALAG